MAIPINCSIVKTVGVLIYTKYDKYSYITFIEGNRVNRISEITITSFIKVTKLLL